jgi:hypothetical protein
MSLDFSIFGLILLGVILFVILCASMVVVFRAMIRQQQYLAKWDFLHAVEDADKPEHLPRCRDERIQPTKDQIQQGGAS